MIQFSDGVKLTYYQWLGLDPKADKAAIINAYRKMSLKVHPDTQPEDRKKGAHEAFVTLGEVRDVLLNPEKRARYDQSIGLVPVPQAPPRPDVTVQWYSQGAQWQSDDALGGGASSGFGWIFRGQRG